MLSNVWAIPAETLSLKIRREFSKLLATDCSSQNQWEVWDVFSQNRFLKAFKILKMKAGTKWVFPESRIITYRNPEHTNQLCSCSLGLLPFWFHGHLDWWLVEALWLSPYMSTRRVTRWGTYVSLVSPQYVAEDTVRECFWVQWLKSVPAPLCTEISLCYLHSNCPNFKMRQ